MNTELLNNYWFVLKKYIDVMLVHTLTKWLALHGVKWLQPLLPHLWKIDLKLEQFQAIFTLTFGF